MPTCFKCSRELHLPSGPVSRSAECSCGADVRVCMNCLHYDRSAYNECREPQAERVLDKDRRNQCDYFSLRHTGLQRGTAGTDDAKRRLEELFKK